MWTPGFRWWHALGGLLAQLKQAHSNAVTEVTWQWAARPAETGAPPADDLGIQRQLGPNAQLLSSLPAGNTDRQFCFDDLPADLQTVLRLQLRQPGDISAVIEAPTSFLLYVCQDTDVQALTVACLSLPKRDYEQWLEEQSQDAR